MQVIIMHYDKYESYDLKSYVITYERLFDFFAKNDVYITQIV